MRVRLPKNSNVLDDLLVEELGPQINDRQSKKEQKELMKKIKKAKKISKIFKNFEKRLEQDKVFKFKKYLHKLCGLELKIFEDIGKVKKISAEVKKNKDKIKIFQILFKDKKSEEVKRSLEPRDNREINIPLKKKKHNSFGDIDDRLMFARGNQNRTRNVFPQKIEEASDEKSGEILFEESLEVDRKMKDRKNMSELHDIFSRISTDLVDLFTNTKIDEGTNEIEYDSTLEYSILFSINLIKSNCSYSKNDTRNNMINLEYLLNHRKSKEIEYSLVKMIKNHYDYSTYIDSVQTRMNKSKLGIFVSQFQEGLREICEIIQ